MMNYRSTRDVNCTFSCTSAQAIKQGLASDGGLFVPLELPVLTEDFLASLSKESYAVRAAKILHLFLDDYSEEELQFMIRMIRTVYPPQRYAAWLPENA